MIFWPLDYLELMFRPRRSNAATSIAAIERRPRVFKNPVMPRTRRIFTPNNLLRMRQMAGEGSSSIEIAACLGSTPGSVRVMCCYHKIKFSRGQGQRSITNAVSKPVPSSVQAVVACLPVSVCMKLRRKAEQLQLSASVLASRLLAAIVVSNIYEAVLDDD